MFKVDRELTLTLHRIDAPMLRALHTRGRVAFVATHAFRKPSLNKELGVGWLESLIKDYYYALISVGFDRKFVLVKIRLLRFD